MVNFRSKRFIGERFKATFVFSNGRRRILRNLSQADLEEKFQACLEFKERTGIDFYYFWELDNYKKKSDVSVERKNE